MSVVLNDPKPPSGKKKVEKKVLTVKNDIAYFPPTFVVISPPTYIRNIYSKQKPDYSIFHVFIFKIKKKKRERKRDVATK